VASTRLWFVDGLRCGSSRSGLGVGGHIVLPRLLEMVGLQTKSLRVDRTRIESMASFGRILGERGEIEKPLAAFDRAVKISEALGDPSAAAHGRYAHTLDLQAQQLVADGMNVDEKILQLAGSPCREEPCDCSRNSTRQRSEPLELCQFHGES
jgi:hypothetical protein